MIPTPRLATLVALGVPLALLSLFGTTGLVVFLLYDGLLLVALVADRLAIADPRRLRVERQMPARVVQGQPVRVRLRLSHDGPGRMRVVLRELPPSSFDIATSRFDAVVAAHHETSVDYAITPRERGTQEFGSLAIRARGPLDLVRRQAVVPLATRVRVYPDLVRLSAREAALVHPARWVAGARRDLAMGEGSEFHELRPYQTGDDLRLVDWKASARRRMPVVRQQRAERGQRVLLLLDAGRLMTVEVGDRLRFDWAVQAAGRLARVALALGDRVAVAAFSRTVRARLPASRGAGHLGKIAELLADVRPDLDEPHLGRALRELLRTMSRRSLVVVFTELADPRTAEATLRWVGALAPRHLGIVVTLADVRLEAARHREVTDAESAWTRVAADEVWQEVRRVEQALEARAVHVVRASADALAAGTVERYLAVKRRGLL